MNSPRIAVVLPTHNRLGMLKRTLKSLEAQEFKDFIVYISDDASTDDTRLLGSGDFPNLQVQVLRRAASFPSLPEHFTYLFYSVKEEIVAMAHDDEVYHPAWLRLMAECFADPDVVFAYGQTVVVDAKTPTKTFYIGNDEIKQGSFTGQEVKERFLHQRLFLPANGFAVRSSAVAKIAPLSPGYEQFDYEWMMRLVYQGKTRVIPDYLTSYTVHSSNTVGSRRYLQRFLNQKSSNQMAEEWLDDLTNLDPSDKAAIQDRLDRGQANLDWLMCIRALGYGDRELGQTYGQRFLSRDKAKPLQKTLVRLALAPAFTPLAGTVLGTIFRARAKKPMLKRPDISPLDKARAIAMFPTLALFDEPLS